MRFELEHDNEKRWEVFPGWKSRFIYVLILNHFMLL